LRGAWVSGGTDDLPPAAAPATTPTAAPAAVPKERPNTPLPTLEAGRLGRQTVELGKTVFIFCISVLGFNMNSGHFWKLWLYTFLPDKCK